MSFAHKFSQARSLYKKGQIPDAIYLYFQLLAHFPKNTKVKDELLKISKADQHPSLHPTQQVLRGIVSAHKNGQSQAAYNQARALSERFPQSSIVSNIYGAICAELNLLSEAKSAFKRSLSLHPANPDACNNLANIYRELRDLDEANLYYQLAVIFEPRLTEAHLNLGNTLAEKKKFEEARKAFKDAVNSNPNSGSAYRYLSQHTKFEKSDPIIRDVAKLLEADDLDEFNRSELYFAQAKICEDTKDFAGAFAALKNGGTLKQKIFGYRRSRDEEAFAHSAQLLDMLEETSLPADEEYAGPLPIFVLGMPRSGTTLVEQIISAHSKARAGGELPTAELLFRKFFFPNHRPNDRDILKFRANYLTKVFQLSDGNTFLTDKMPQNFLHIGLLRKAIPECKIIHIKRDPKATCWSNFRHCFQSQQMGFSFDLDDTVAYYNNYVEFMTLIDRRFGQEIYTLDYDLLCEEPQTEITKLLEYLELPLENACFNPHENDFVARTTSQLQVQKPIYRGSSSAWKRYEEHAEAAFKALE